MMRVKDYIYARSKWVYHLVFFLSFAIMVLLFPYLLVQAAVYSEHLVIQYLLAIVVTYAGARFILPFVGFWIAKSSMRPRGDNF